MAGPQDGGTPWASKVIPKWTLAPEGARTPSGFPAVFRSSPHAWFALRLVYLAAVAMESAETVAETAARYERAWDRFVRHGTDMRQLVTVVDCDLSAAAGIWNSIDQHEVDDAFSTVICEREPFPKINLATLALKHFQLGPVTSDASADRDRKFTRADNEAAWRATDGGACQGCGTPTISQYQYDQLRRVLPVHADLFDLAPNYRQTNGHEAQLWSNRILIAAKAVADHKLPWSQGGRTSSENLANVCAGCNYSRHNTSLDVVRVAAYT